MELLELKDFARDGVFFEDHFDEVFSSYDWDRFNDKAVRVSNCGMHNVPGWVYLQIGIELAKRARKVFFGDSNKPKRIFKRSEVTGTS